MAHTTKRTLSETLKKILQEKSLDKVTVVDIVETSAINRQTFYYHFQDKYELLVWIYFNELFAPNMEDISLENWDEKLGAILTQMQEEKKFYINREISEGDK
jgi:probable dihydroxyacetone kinase regulator